MNDKYWQELAVISVKTTVKTTVKIMVNAIELDILLTQHTQ